MSNRSGWFSANFAYIGSFTNVDGAEAYQYVCTSDVETIHAIVEQRQLLEAKMKALAESMDKKLA